MVMKYPSKVTSICLALAVAGITYSLHVSPSGLISAFGPVYAQDKEEEQPRRRTRQVETLGLKVVEALQEAQAEVDLDNMAGALEIINDLFNGKRPVIKNDFETSTVYNFRAYLQYQTGDTPAAIKSYETILGLEKIQPQVEMNTLYALAQLSFTTEEYKKSIGYLQRWFRLADSPDTVTTPTALHYVFLGQAYYSDGDFDNAIPQILKAIELAQTAGEEVKENWYAILRSMYFEKKEMQKVKEILEILVVEYPKPGYWLELAQVYGELEEDMKQLAVLEVAYHAGYLERPAQVKLLAQIYMFQRVPYKASKVMAKALKDEFLEKNADNYKLYAESLVMAQELDDSIDPLTIAADLAEDGDLYMRLAGVYAEKDKWQESIDSVDAALKKGIDREDTARMLRGTANFNLEKYDEAIADFRIAARDERSAKDARQWINFLTREKDRLAKLAQAAK